MQQVSPYDLPEWLREWQEQLRIHVNSSVNDHTSHNLHSHISTEHKRPVRPKLSDSIESHSSTSSVSSSSVPFVSKLDEFPVISMKMPIVEIPKPQRPVPLPVSSDARLKDLCSEDKSRINALLNEIVKINGEKERLVQTLADYQTQSESRISTLQSTLSDSESELLSVRNKLFNALSMIKEYQSKLVSYSEQTCSQQYELADLRARYEVMESERFTAESLTSSFENLKQDLAGIRKIVDMNSSSTKPALHDVSTQTDTRPSVPKPVKHAISKKAPIARKYDKRTEEAEISNLLSDPGYYDDSLFYALDYLDFEYENRLNEEDSEQDKLAASYFHS